jgi:hypothetical protein
VKRNVEREMVFASEKQEASPPVESTYRAFLLRCWREPGAGPDDTAVWRFCLLEPGGGETERGFAGLEALLTYLLQELEAG